MVSNPRSCFVVDVLCKPVGNLLCNRLARFKCLNCLQGIVLCVKLIAAIAKPYYHAVHSRTYVTVFRFRHIAQQYGNSGVNVSVSLFNVSNLLLQFRML